MESPVDELTTLGYSLGATLYRLLTDSAPYGGERWQSPLQKLRAMANEPVPSIVSRRPDLPAKLAAIVDRCLAKDPADRIATMDELAAELAPLPDGSDLAGLVEPGIAAASAASNTPAESLLEAAPNRDSQWRLSGPESEPLRCRRYNGLKRHAASPWHALRKTWCHRHCQADRSATCLDPQSSCYWDSWRMSFSSPPWSR
jgi:serine/threonine protein kinase